MTTPAGITVHPDLNHARSLLRSRDFLTGFHKRKLEKQDAARKKALEREKSARLEARREVRSRLI